MDSKLSQDEQYHSKGKDANQVVALLRGSCAVREDAVRPTYAPHAQVV